MEQNNKVGKKRKNNSVTNFMYYIFNKWNIDEAVELFGLDLGSHIYNKYLEYNNCLLWYSALDEKRRNTIVDRANELYNK